MTAHAAMIMMVRRDNLDVSFGTAAQIFPKNKAICSAVHLQRQKKLLPLLITQNCVLSCRYRQARPG